MAELDPENIDWAALAKAINGAAVKVQQAVEEMMMEFGRLLIEAHEGEELPEGSQDAPEEPEVFAFERAPRLYAPDSLKLPHEAGLPESCGALLKYGDCYICCFTCNYNNHICPACGETMNHYGDHLMLGSEGTKYWALFSSVHAEEIKT